ncbi:uroporphyrinogen-III C-methyltransferase [Tolumonas osonensis]|uniref:uroporphyrinogen-III C-methyltransferase n=1 Tax=Tolumonas osonensis TaxID=675874 RepID=A0A841GJE6_9GAMM|nr:uroporphyrinogen-III C-methyltransferase [Tolumonas osonensis]MBB6054632.1 uroporphyrin-III C-methyltransferase [Tolumonas osonensis]
MNGKVWLVGAGPGDPSLITVKGLHCIRHADVLVYDRLVCKELLAEVPAGCEMINVGKTPNNHPIPQDEINQILVAQALMGRNVVRLKGGDPYVFGRGGEEVETLAQSGIPFEVIPGITSAIGGLAYAGIPVTHRDHASSFHVITGHLQQGKDPQDWPTLAKLQGTLVILMGMSQIETICQQLIEHGKAASTPAAAVMCASHQVQKIAQGTLATLPQDVLREGIKSPALIVIGNVVQLQKLLQFTPTVMQLDEMIDLSTLAEAF